MNPLSLVLEYRIIQHPVCIEEKVEIIETDDRFLFGENAEAILIDEKIDVLAQSQRQRGDSEAHRNQRLTLRMSRLSR